MTAIVAGQGLGLINTSLGLLGGQGQIGVAAQGRSGEKVAVNAANGNLVIQQQDEWLVGAGPDVGIVRTYNSLATGDDDNGDNWRLGFNRKIVASGTFNVAGHTVTRTDEDGHESIYLFDATRGAYLSRDGQGSVDTLKWDSTSSTWTWTDGSTQIAETYKVVGAVTTEYRLQTVQDLDGKVLTLTYNTTDRLITKITDASGEVIDIEYGTSTANKNIKSITSSYTADGVTSIRSKRVSYDYDTNNRLITVTVDLTPANAVDAKVYVTSYTYDDAVTAGTKRIKTLTQTGGSKLEFSYDAASGYKVATVKEYASDTDVRTTTLAYAAGTTTIQDTLGQKTVLTYDTSAYAATNGKAGQLLSVTAPAINGVSQITTYTYDASGNVASVKDARSVTTTYRYDSNGNRVYERDDQGNVVKRTYGGRNQLLSETRYTGQDDPQATTNFQTGALATRYIYDAQNHLRFTISPEGRVAEYQYNANGQRSSVVQYTDVYTTTALNAWSQDFNTNTNGLTPTALPTGIVRSTGTNGALVFTSTQTTAADTYPTVRAASAPLGTNWRAEITLPATISKNLLHIGLESGTFNTANYRRSFLRISDGQFSLNTYQGTVLSEAVLGPATGGKTYVLEIETQADGSSQLYVYESGKERSSGYAGQASLANGTNLAQFTMSGFCGATAATPATAGSTNTISVDNLSSQQPPSEVELSNWANSRPAKASRTDYTYDLRGQLSNQITYTSTDSGGQGVLDGTQNRTVYVYDQAGNLLNRIDGRGDELATQDTAWAQAERTRLGKRVVIGATPLSAADQTALRAIYTASYAYDGLNRVLLQTDPLGNATTTVYDDANLKTAVTMANGLVSTSTYDRAGHLLSANRMDGAVAMGTTSYTYDKLGRLVITSTPTGEKSFIVYDAVGRKVGEVTAEGALTEFVYNAQDQLVRNVRYFNLVSSAMRSALGGDPLTTTLPGIADIRPALTATDDRTQYSIYDKAGRLSKTIDAVGAVVEYRYDGASRQTDQLAYWTVLDATQIATIAAGNGELTAANGTIVVTTNGVASTITLISHGSDRRVRNFYSADGLLLGQLDGDGFYTGNTYDNTGRLIRTTRYFNNAGVVPEGNVPPTVPTSATNDQVTQYVYNGRNQLIGVVDAESYYTSYDYDAAGNKVGETRYATRVSYVTGSNVPPVAAPSVASTNNVLQSQNFGTAPWSATASGGGSLPVVTANAGTAPDGSATATRVVFSRTTTAGDDYSVISQAFTASASTSTSSVWVRSNTGAAQTILLLGDGNWDTYREISVGTQWTRIQVSGTSLPGFQFGLRKGGGAVNATSADILVWGAQNEAGAASSEYIATTTVPVTAAVKANNVLQSQSFTSAPWSGTNSGGGSLPVSTANAGVAPDGSSTATRVVFARTTTTGDDYSVISQAFNATQTGTTTSSIWVRSNTGAAQTILFRGQGNWNVYKEVTVGTQWTRIQVTGTGLAGIQFGLRRGGGIIDSLSADILVWGAQNESSPTATDYIATTTKAVSVARPEDQKTLYTYDANNRITLKEDRPTGVKTSYAYDAMGNLTKTIKAVGVALEERAQQSRYDKLGRVTAELGGVGSKVLQDLLNANPAATQADKDLIWQQYGVQYLYDIAGRRIAMIEPNGTNTAGLKTIYYYNKNGALTHSINALGEVVQYGYSNFGDQGSVTRVATRVSNVSALTGGLASTLGSAIQLSASLDTTTKTGYDRRGQLARTADAFGNLSLRWYTAFGQVTSARQYIDATTTAQTNYGYDRRGNLRTSTEINLSNRIIEQKYDAFNRVITRIDGNVKTTTLSYDKLGRQVLVTDPNGATNASTYDAFSRTLSTTDGLGNVSTYTYDGVNRKVTLTTPELIQTVTESNRFGQTVQVTNGRSAVSTYTYNADGQLLSATDPAGTVSTTYDMAGRTYETKDGRGTITRTTYDAANRVLTRIVDAAAGGLNLSTQYIYDAKGQAVWSKDANGVWTKTEYNLNGEVTAVVVDPKQSPTWVTGQPDDNSAGLAIRTEYTYDGRGKTLTVTEGVGSAQPKTTQYIYDAAGRRTSEIVDPAGLKLTTAYTYDKADNVVARTDAKLQVTRYVYDASNQLIYSVDATGAVTKTEYDQEGRVSRTTAYANRIELGATTINSVASPAFGLNITATDITARLTADSTRDQISISVYDKNGRLSVSIDALNYASKRSYDGAGNVIAVRRYATKVAVPAIAKQTGNLVSFAAPTLTANDGTDQVTKTAYDTANRPIWSVDALNGVTRRYFDANGNVTQTTRYYNPATAVAADSTPTVAADTQSPSRDQITYTVYDSANRATFVIDPESYVTQNKYDSNGHLTSSTRFAGKLGGTYAAWQGPTVLEAGANLPTSGSWVYKAASSDTQKDAATNIGYDNAGRQTTQSVTDGSTTLSAVRKKYDAAGHVTDVIDADSTGQDVTTHYNYDTAGRVVDEIVGYRADGTGPQQTDYADTRYVLDAVGNWVGVIDPRGVELAEGTTTWAQQQRLAILGSTTAPAKSTDPASSYQQLLKRYTTTQTFDANGHVTQSVDALNGITDTQYDAFGNAIKITDPNRNSGYFYFDQLNQATWQVDPLGYATQTSYNTLGQVTGIIKYAKPAKNLTQLNTAQPPATYTTVQITALVPPQSTAAYIELSSGDGTSSITHDLLGRQLQITDAENAMESMTYDALGNKSTYTNKLTGKYTYTYDRNGNLLTEILPENVNQYGASGTITSTAPVDVKNVYTYDARGNRLTSTEGSGLQEQRVSTNTYDALDRLITQGGQSTNTYTTAGGTQSGVTPQLKSRYDARGNLIEVTAPDGGRTLSYYDALNRKVAEVNAVGTLTTYTYNEGGDLLSQQVYADALSVASLVAGAAVPSPISSTKLRQSQFTYDANHRLVSAAVKNALVGEVNTATGNYEMRGQDVVTSKQYDANGNVVAEVDGRGNTTWHYFDKAGRQIAQVDALRYMTVWVRDALGNVVDELRYANKVPSSVVINASSAASDLQNAVKAGEVRETKVAFDKLGRVRTQTVVGVQAGQLDATTHQAVVSAQDATTSFTYNGQGQVLTKTEATGEVLNWTFDKQGRETKSEGALFTDYRAAQTQASQVRQTTDSEYNALGQKVRSIERGYGTQADRTTYYAFGVNGVLDSQLDAAGARTSFKYDAAGRQTAKSLTRLDASGANASTDITTYSYDAGGRQTQTAAYNVAGSGVFLQNGTTYTALSTQESSYDAYGDVIASGSNGGWQVKAEFDATGRAIKTNAGTGVTKAYVFDAMGNATLTIESTGVDLGPLAYADILARSDTHQKVAVFDARNQLTDTYETNVDASNAKTTAPWINAAVDSGTGDAFVVATPTATSALSDSAQMALGTFATAAVDVSAPAINYNTRLTQYGGYVRVGATAAVTLPDALSKLPGAITLVSSMLATPRQTASGSFVEDLEVWPDVDPIPDNAKTISLEISGRIFAGGYLSAEFHVYKMINGQNVDISGAISFSLDDRNSVQKLNFSPQACPAVALILRNQPAGANHMVLAYRGQNSSSSWKVVTLNSYGLDTNGTPLFALIKTPDTPLPAGNYEMQYVALSDVGDVLNSAQGTMQVTASAITVTQSARTMGGAGHVLVDTEGKLNITEQGGNAATAVLTITSADGLTTKTLPATTAALINGVLMPGWFQFDLSGLSLNNGNYNYTLTCLGADGTTVTNKVGGNFSKGANGLSTQSGPTLISSSSEAGSVARGQFNAGAVQVSAPAINYNTRLTQYGGIVNVSAAATLTLPDALSNLPGAVTVVSSILATPRQNTSGTFVENLEVWPLVDPIPDNAKTISLNISGRIFTGSYLPAEFHVYKMINGQNVDISGAISFSLDDRNSVQKLNFAPQACPAVALILRNQPKGASHVVLAYRGQNSSSSWKVVTLNSYGLDTNGTPIFALVNTPDTPLPASNYEMQYVALSDAGDVLNSAQGTMQVTASAITVTQSARNIIRTGYVLIDPNGKINIWGLGGNQSNATLTITSQSGVDVAYTVPAALSAMVDSANKPVFGCYQFDPSSLNLKPGTYTYILDSRTSDGIAVATLLKGDFTLGTQPSISKPQMLPCYQNVTFQNLPLNVASGRVYYKAKTQGAVEQNAFLTISSAGTLTWSTLSLASAQAQDYDIRYEAYNSGGQVVSAGQKTITLGGSAAMVQNLSSTLSAPAGSLPVAQRAILGVANIAQSSHRSVKTNAYGEIIEQTDTLGHVTTLSYNAMGKLVSKQDPMTTVVDATGLATRARPLTSFAYDLQGRLISTTDANTNSVTQSWIAEGANGQAHIDTEYHADGGKKISRYDRFGDQIQAINENWDGQDGTKAGYTTTYSYDGDHRVLKVARPLRDGKSVTGYDRYTYDSAGNRVAHYATTDGTAELTPDLSYFDAMGRVVKQVSAQSRTTTVLYEDGVNVTGLNSQTVIGSRKTTTDANSNKLIDEQDFTGRVTKHTDLGQHVYQYQYNAAGWLMGQTSSVGQNIGYQYYTDGKLQQISDYALGTYSKYAYDSEGNKTYEAYATRYDFNVYQRASIVYDELNRIKTITDPQYTLSYDYDAAGNRRHLIGTTSSTGTKQEYWYAYDTMDRFLVTMGTLTGVAGATGTKITAGPAGGDGVSITYDKIGQRMQADIVRDGHSERYGYSKDGFLVNTYLTNAGKYVAPSATNATGATAGTADYWLGAWRESDLMGRVGTYTEYLPGGAGTSVVTTYTYDNDSKTKDQHAVQSGTNTTTTDTHFDMLGDGTVQHIGVTSSTSAGGAPTIQNTYYTYAWWDSAQQSKITEQAYNADLQNTWKPGTSDLSYDVNGHVTQAYDRVAGRTLSYINNAQGLVLFRTETRPSVATKNQAFYYVDSQRVGETGNDTASRTIDYAQALASNRLAANPKAVHPVTSNFDANYQPINGSYPAFTSNGYTAKDGDTLESIARSVWGDASLWYLIADANGMMSASTALTAGQTLVIPNKVTNVHNSSQTHAVYDAGAALGNVSPTLPDPPPPPPPDDDGCGTLGTIIMVVVAVVVTVITAGAAAAALGPVLAGALAGAAGSIASQAVGMAMGNVKSFSWSSVAMGAISGAVGGAISGVGPGEIGSATHTAGYLEQSFNTLGGGANTFATAVLKATVSNVATQGLAMAVGLQKQFSWTSVAAAGVGTAASFGASTAMGPDFGNEAFGKFGGSVVRGTVSGIASGWAGAMARHDKPDWGAVAANSFGSALGDSVVGSIASQDQKQSQYVSKPLTRDDINGFLAGTDDPALSSNAPSSSCNGGSMAFANDVAARGAQTKANQLNAILDQAGADAYAAAGSHSQTVVIRDGQTLSGATGISDPQTLDKIAQYNGLPSRHEVPAGFSLEIPDQSNLAGITVTNAIASVAQMVCNIMRNVNKHKPVQA